MILNTEKPRTSFPRGISHYQYLKHIILAQSSIQELPKFPPHIQILNLSACQELKAPLDLSSYIKLKKLNLSHATWLTSLEQLPSTLEELDVSGCPRLLVLDLSRFTHLKRLTVNTGKACKNAPPGLIIERIHDEDESEDTQTETKSSIDTDTYTVPTQEHTLTLSMGTVDEKNTCRFSLHG